MQGPPFVEIREPLILIFTLERFIPNAPVVLILRVIEVVPVPDSWAPDAAEIAWVEMLRADVNVSAPNGKVAPAEPVNVISLVPLFNVREPGPFSVLKKVMVLAAADVFNEEVPETITGAAN